MPRRKKTFADHADDAIQRHGLSGARKKAFWIYADSVQARLKEVDFAYAEIDDLYDQPDQSTTAHALTLDEQMFFKCSTFWSMAYSVFDIIAHVGNAVHQIHTDERKVSFKSIPSDWGRVPPIQAEARRIIQRKGFIRLDAFRNCILHRRSPLVERHDVSAPKPYMRSDSTSTIPQKRREWIVCDDPYDVEGKTTRNLELRSECSKVLRLISEETIKFVKVI